ncbi:MAG: rhomboid family intramembrane serine protease [Bacteroidetes bacterium]|nr:rhomboid family intramembrane serine protease [Bacteroidota bacterium]
MSQYRQSPFANITPVVKNLLIINIIFFIATYVLGSRFDMVRWLSVFYFDSPLFRPWQIVTYMFMHGGWEHIFFNMFALFMFGPILEYSLGSKKFFNLYFICGIGAIILQMVVQAIEVHSLIGTFVIHDQQSVPDPAVMGKLKDIYTTPVLGASGAIFGLLVAFGMMYPNMELFIFFIPIPIKAKYIIPVYIILELWLGVAQYGGDNVAHFAHLGGALFGYVMIKLWGIRGGNNYF